MKKYLFLMLAMLLVASCEKIVLSDMEDDAPEMGVVGKNQVKKFKFTIKGDFDKQTFTRGYLRADDKDMTDLWVLDYMDGALVQQLHQVPTDDGWGEPTLSLKYGQHHVYFVASRGAEPTLDTEAHTVTWGTTSDTFWKDYVVEVVSTSNGNRAVTLDRVATKLTISLTDEVPAGCASVTVTPETWYYGLDYMTGLAVGGQKKERVLTVPASYIAPTENRLKMSFFGISSAEEWTTDVAVVAKDGSGNVMGTASIAGAPFKRNRATEYSGELFGKTGTATVSLNSGWDEPTTGSW